LTTTGAGAQLQPLGQSLASEQAMSLGWQYDCPVSEQVQPASLGPVTEPSADGGKPGLSAIWTEPSVAAEDGIPGPVDVIPGLTVPVPVVALPADPAHPHACAASQVKPVPQSAATLQPPR
jgi:hypothetical protein